MYMCKLEYVELLASNHPSFFSPASEKKAGTAGFEAIELQSPWDRP